MRLAGTALVVTLLAVVPASSQTAVPAPPEHPYGLDPYDPSDAALLREYGVTLVAQTPLEELRKLDPYKPSHAALLRQLGGGIPLWGWAWYASPGPTQLTPFPPPGVTSPPPPTAGGFPRRQSRSHADRPEPGVVAPRSATSIATLRKPESNDGVWIRYSQRTWISAGRPVPFEDSAFLRVGLYEEFPVFKRRGVNDEVIYVPTRKGWVVPYRLKP